MCAVNRRTGLSSGTCPTGFNTDEKSCSRSLKGDGAPGVRDRRDKEGYLVQGRRPRYLGSNADGLGAGSVWAESTNEYHGKRSFQPMKRGIGSPTWHKVISEAYALTGLVGPFNVEDHERARRRV